LPPGSEAQVVDEPRRGFGAACFAGLCAVESEVVCFMDCDGSLDPGDLPQVVALLDQGADLALGARRAGRGAWPFHARIANRVSPASCAVAPEPGSRTSARCGLPVARCSSTSA